MCTFHCGQKLTSTISETRSSIVEVAWSPFAASLLGQGVDVDEDAVTDRTVRLVAFLRDAEDPKIVWGFPWGSLIFVDPHLFGSSTPIRNNGFKFTARRKILEAWL